jgi:ubiquinone/menaquinone biosynthesis C-methylase UbiE
MSESDTSEHWSAVGKEILSRESNQELAGDDSPYYRYKRDLFLKRFLPKVRVEGRAVLEVGCGPGGNLAEIQKRHPSRLAGCDIAPDMVALASKNIPSADIRLAEGQELPYADDEFDVVITVTVVQHNPDEIANQMLKEICRVSRSEVFLFEDTTKPGPDTGAYRNYHGRLPPWYVDAVTENGFDLVEVQSLATYVSQRTDIFLRRLDRAKSTEGSPISRAHLAVEKSALPLTSQLDKLMKYWKWGLPKGFSPPELTMMSFVKQSHPAP